ncbi:MAG: bifunctional 2-polyprenyl-6-hydroxyphenol methylase/3-demethylubiquinol 3-O-methyltransferase UbiG [Proteobacteria bacterium]|nr:bifunctional 2-polyprenyl-6-hydroxyphenol methylase/3-demethylubiquinol 3-O-methyltransferase UbiG [Pseudomonadota bacterium]
MKEKSMSSVDAEEIERFSRIAEQWWDSEGKFKPLHRINPLRIEYIRLQACRHFGLSSADSAPLTGLRVLDIGCGGGLVCEPLRRLGAQVTGIDAAEKNIKVAALHAEKSGLDIDYRATTAEALLETGAQYDMVLALEVVEHVADVPAFVETCTRLVKPGGLMVWATLNRTPQSFAMAIVGAEYVLRWLPVGTHSWKKFLKPSELGGALRRCGMTVTHLTGMVMQPLSGKWRLDSGNLSVNYLLTAQKT